MIEARQRTSFLAAGVLFVGCATPTNAHRVELPPSFERAAPGPSAASLDTRTFFGDDSLRSLIEEALAANPDVQVALQRIELTRAGSTRTAGALWPWLSARAGAGLTRYGRYTEEGAGNATTEYARGRLIPNPVGDFSVGIVASWEADIWGKLRSRSDAAREQVLASSEGAGFVVTTLVSDVAIAYFDLVALDHVRDVLAQTIARQTEALEMMRAQKEAGRTNELAVQQFEAQLASTHVLDATAQQQAREVENQLNVLLGRPPRPIARSQESLHRDSVVPAAGLPADLLQNRPDIREAEHLVRAAVLDVASARAAFFPTIALSADLGYRSFEPQHTFATPDSVGYSGFAGVTWPVLNWSDLQADLGAATATQAQALQIYRGIVLRSVAEVATRLGAVEQAEQVLAQRKRKRTAVAGTVEAADALFRAGKATYLEVLVAQQNSLDADLEVIDALRRRHIERIQLYRAVGGGWSRADGDPLLPKAVGS